MARRKTDDTNDKWEELGEFLDGNEFYIADMLACVCAGLLRNDVKEYKTRLMVAGVEYEIEISEKRGFDA